MSSGFAVRLTLLAALAGTGFTYAQTAPAGIDPAERRLAIAEGLAERGQYDLANQEFTALLKEFPNTPLAIRAHYGRGLALYNLNDYPNAAKELEAAIADKTFERRDSGLAVLSSLYLALNAPDKALKTSDTLLKDHPSSTQVEGAMINRAQALYRLSRYEDSRAQAAALLKVYPTSTYRSTALYIAALDQRGLGNDPAAETLAREIVAKYPTAPYVWDAQVLIGETLAGQGKIDEAVAHFKTVDSQTPTAKKPAVQFGLAMTLARAARYDEARQAFAVITDQYKDSPLVAQAKLQTAVTLVKSGQRDLARPQLADVIEKYPALGMSATYWLARCDILDSKFEDAKKSLETLLAKKVAIPEVAEAVFDLAYCELALGQDETAAQRLEAFRAAYPYSAHTAEALYYEATAMHRLSKFADSERFCDAVLKMGKTDMRRPAEMLRGENKLMEKAYAEADAIFEGLEVGASANEKMRLALRRGQCAYYAADYAKATSFLVPIAKEMTVDPLQQEAVFLLGDAELQQKRYGDAVGTLEMYLQKPAAHGDEASYKLAMAQVGMKDRKAAGATLQKLIQGDMQNEWVQRGIFEMGRMAYEDRKLDAAGKAMKLVLATDAGEGIAAPAMYLQARIEMETSKPAEAAARLAELVKKFPKNALAEEATFTRGAALKDAGKAKEAVAQFDAYIAAYPKGRFVTEAWHQGAASLTLSGKPADAVKILTQLASAKETRNDAVLYDLAWAQRTGGDAKSAAGTYEALIKEFPAGMRVDAARVELAELYAQDDRIDEAVGLLETALADPGIDPRSRAVALYRLGAGKLRQGEGEKAGAAFDQFVMENSNDALVPAALAEAGAAYTQAERFDAAAMRLNKVLTLFDKTDAAKLAGVRVGDLQNQQQQYEKAAATFAAWMKEHPNDALLPLAEFGMGWSLENRGKFEEARGWYAKVIAVDRGATGARAQFQIGETYFKEKNFETSAKELLTVDILYKAPEWAAPALYEAGCAFDAMGDGKRAREQWEECIKKYPKAMVAGMAKKKLEGK